MMGKGTNATHINEGLYTVDYQYDTDAITARITTLTTRLGELNSEKGTVTSDISIKKINITSKEDTINQNIDDLNDLKSELSDLNSNLNGANTRLDEILDEITEQENLLAPINARMLIITVFLSPIQTNIASKQAELAEATDPAVIAQLTSEIEALQEQETILSDEYDDLNEQKTPITTAISELQTEQLTLQGTDSEQGTVSTLEGQIASKEAEITTLRDTKHSNESDLSGYRADLLELEAKLSSIKLQIASTQKSIDALSDIPTSVPDTYVWCADLTEDLSGEVGIMEVAGFEDSGINIQPGYEGNAVYDEDRDGIMVPAEATSGAQSFWNKAMQGGWQKWKPTFRWGTITVIDYELDTCSVTMSTETNPDTGLDVNKMATLSDVPIEYMSCNSAPFAIDDTVVVKFNGQSWDDPVVIGFTSEPKPCGPYLLIWDYISDYAKTHPPCDTTPCNEKCVVWNIGQNAEARITDNNGDLAVFPILRSQITDWIDTQEELTGVKALFTSTQVNLPSHEASEWTWVPIPLSWGLPYDNTGTCTNEFGQSTVHLTASATNVGDYEGYDGPMWCEGSMETTDARSELTGKRYTALNDSAETIDLVQTKSTDDSTSRSGAWTEGTEGSGSVSVSESESTSIQFPIFDVEQSGGYSRSNSCECDYVVFGCVGGCDPFSGEEIETELHLPSLNSFNLSGSYYDTTGKLLWIFWLATMEDNTTRDPENTNEANGDIKVKAGLESGKDFDPQKSPTEVVEQTDLSALLQTIMDDSVAASMLYQIYK